MKRPLKNSCVAVDRPEKYQRVIVELPMWSQLLDNDAAWLKKILEIDALGYCSASIEIAEAALKTIVDDGLLTGRCDPETEILAKLVAQRSIDRQRLLVFLKSNEFDQAKNVIGKNPYILHTYKDDSMFDLLSAVFAQKIIDSSASAQTYTCIRELMHSGFSLDVRDTAGIPLLCRVVRYDNDKYVDVLKGGASVNMHDKDGNTALYYAAALCDHDKIEKLLSYGAVFNHNIGNKIPVTHCMRPFVVTLFLKQYCIDCKTHDRSLANIPCVNRHLEHFMCGQCYNQRCTDSKKCPLCRRSLGEFGT